MDIQKVKEALIRNRMEVHVLETAAEVVPTIKELLPRDSVVSCGGSMSLQEAGVMDLLRSGHYRFLDRARPGITLEEVQQVYRDTFGADAYFCSANAITEQGELVNVDGNCNRIAAIAFGPEKVFVVAGINKLVTDVEAGLKRVKTTAAPKNTQRLSCNTYCREKGVCVDPESGFGGCHSEGRICCNYLISGPQRKPGRMVILLVNEPLGY